MAVAGQRFTWIFCALLATLSGVLAGYPLAYRWEDAYWYYQIADGKTNLVIHPFSVRQLAPLSARLLHQITPLNLNHSFAILGVICIVFFAGAYFWLLRTQRVPWAWMVTAAALSFWATSFSNYMLPDLLNDALLLAFIILLMKERYIWSSLILFPLALSRESVLLILIAYLVAATGRIRWPALVGSIVSTFAGLQAAKHLAASSAGNRHGLGDLAYVALKMPFNFAVNVLGIDPWLNTLTRHCSVPVRAIHLPFPVGAIREVGYCGFGLFGPLDLAASLLCQFSPFILLLLFLVAYHRTTILNQSVYLRFCLLYGGACFLLAPFLGAAVDRLVSYSWPVFLIAAPILGSRLLKQPRAFGRVALPLYGGLVSWLFYISGNVLHSEMGLISLIFGTLIGGWYIWSAYFAPELPAAVSSLS